MWPMLLDFTEDECRRFLRKLELEAYASVISAFRAQGELTKEKKKMLQELSTALSISVERHRAEIRRAVNDERLNTIADRVSGPNTTTDWSIEGRRVIPLMPRMIPQTAFTALANYAADAQAAKNATMPIPSATGLKDACHNDENEKSDIEPVRKRSSTPEPSVIPDKIIALEQLPINPTPYVESTSEINNDLLAQSNSPVPQCVLQSVLGKDVGLFSKTSTVASVSKPLVSSPITQSSKAFTTATSATTVTTVSAQKPVNFSTAKPISLPSTSASIQPVKPSFSTVNITTVPSPIETVTVSSVAISPDTPPANAMPTPVFSTSTGLTQPLSTTVTSAVTTRTTSKVVLASKPLMRPRLSPGSVFTAPSQSLSYQNSSSQFPSPNVLQSLHKTVSPLKPRPTCARVSSPVTSSAVAQCQITLPRSQSPITSVQRVTTPVTSAHRTPSPVTLKQTQSTVSSTVSSKVLSKPSTLRPPLNSRTMITSVAKSPVQKTATSVMVTATASRQTLPLTVKTSLPPQLLSSAKSNASVTYSSKMLPSPSQAKPVAQPVAKTIHYRNDGGLKIISQNLPSNRILPKPSGSNTSQVVTSTSARVITTSSGTAITGNARIVNFSQPISARFARGVPPSSVAAVNLVNSLPVSGLRVALPVGVTNSSVMRSALPAKPNVIVVHKAQVWPQTPGATIVMTSSGSLSRLSNEAIEEAVTIMQRQESGRHSGSAPGFKTVTLHHGSSLSSAHNVGLQTKGAQITARKISEVSQPETQSVRTVDTQASENKNKLRKTFPPDTNVQPAEQQNNVVLSKKEPAEPVVTTTKLCVATTAPIVTVNKFVESSANKKSVKIPTNTINIGKASDDSSAGVRLLNVNMNQQVAKEEICSTSKAEVTKGDGSGHVIPGPVTLPVKTVTEEHDVKENEKNMLEKKLDTESVKEVVSASQISIQDLNLDQLQEGQILELQAHDAAELLSQHGQLSTEVLQFLQQAGLQLEQLEVSEEESPAAKTCSQETSKEYLTTPNVTTTTTTCSQVTSGDLKLNRTESPRVAPSEIGLLDMEEVCDNQNQISESKTELVDPFLKSDAESHCNEDIFLPPVDLSDAETSNEVPHISKDDLNSLQATESLGDSPASQSSLGTLVVNNVTVEMEELDNGALHLSLSPENTVS